jgi:hypothetical protein
VLAARSNQMSRTGVTKDPGQRRGLRHRLPRRRVALLIATALVLALAMPAWSYGRALTAPGAAPWSTRTVDWIRDHGGAPVVDTVENWWFSHHTPSDAPPAAAQLPATTTTVPSAPRRQRQLPVLTDPYAASPLPGEGVWQDRSLDSRGAPLLATAFVRPDPKHASVVAGVAWAHQPGVTAHLVAGTEIPGGPRWPGHADVPASDVPQLVATFNSGWRTKDISGGFQLGRQTWPPLQLGQATAVIDSRGHLDVGTWGRDVGPGSDVVAARQNLTLVVDQGRAVSGLDTNEGHHWGYKDNQHQYTFRSGLGVDRHGDLVYVAGAKMTLPVLANAMVDAGIVRGMELDVHNSFPFFAVWTHPGRTNHATKLLPNMARHADRYLQPDQRDFFYLTTATGSRP